jgi:hypothetical protein
MPIPPMVRTECWNCGYDWIAESKIARSVKACPECGDALLSHATADSSDSASDSVLNPTSDTAPDSVRMLILSEEEWELAAVALAALGDFRPYLKVKTDRLLVRIGDPRVSGPGKGSRGG